MMKEWDGIGLQEEKSWEVLREAASIGTGNAVTELYQRTHQTIRMGVTDVALATAVELHEILGGGSGRVFAFSLHVEGEIKGRLLVLLGQDSAVRLQRRMQEQRETQGTAVLEPGMDALKETLRRMSKVYLVAVSCLTNLKIIGSRPALSADQLHKVLEKPLAGMADPEGKVLCAHTRVWDEERTFEGDFLFLPEKASVLAMLSSTGS
ncbi:chemotaxis protein CheC [Anaerotalea alkaliphila]|uniref:CheC-like protein domain-containing protein n=1 Tax=Anaerotalea alkaliphila TaxID=2662126 RepID=A0A7X5HT38_9FIRM|nr:chemotaxis protein CheC [Anaerotalea alkaliphila]NDL66156.1 hypothetical protein [Anaerotalea alkaliphila]